MKIGEKIKLVQYNSVELEISEKDFIDKFYQYVEFQKIQFFEPPITEKSPYKYAGEINGNKFKLKKIGELPSDNFETCYGDFKVVNDKLNVVIKTDGLQGFLWLIIFILVVLNIYAIIDFFISSSLMFLILIPLTYFGFYRGFLKNIFDNVNELNTKLIEEMKTW